MIRRLRTTVVFGVLALGLVSLFRLPSAASADLSTDRSLPEFTAHEPAAWLNSQPLRVADLEGQVVLVDVWTYGCWNCTRSLPWLKSLEQHYSGKRLRLIGIHSPEFEHEREPAKVAAHVRELDVDFPVMLDADLSYWNALSNRYWPAFYLVDRHGRIRGVYVGETHPGDAQAQRIEGAIDALLAGS